jgi:hypothetical protein
VEKFILNSIRRYFMLKRKALFFSLAMVFASMSILAGNVVAEKKAKSDLKTEVIKTLRKEKKEDSPLYKALKKDHQKYEGIHKKFKTESFKKNFKKIGDDLNKYRKEHPDASSEDLNNYLIETLDKYEKDYHTNKQRVANSDDDLYGYDVDRLNDLEEALLDEEPAKGYYAIAAGVEAWDYTVYLFGKTKYPGGKNDAFRHAYWNITIVMLTDDDWAEAWTDAHEYGHPAYNKNDPNVKMDLHNNKEGRYRAAQDRLDFEDSYLDARESAHTLYKSGKLKYLKNWDKYPSDWGKLILTSFTGSNSDFINDPAY